jgi:hypothetical protein
MQAESDLPMIEVRTDDEYDPSLPAIVDWIIERTHR